ncbi:hypothetical protein AQB9606_04655 [Aquabacterium sp. CECT 9606]|nr:hypothetical protein AQB9606_04655 [Aquabacterium sp. CECT 9606]
MVLPSAVFDKYSPSPDPPLPSSTTMGRLVYPVWLAALM